MIQANAQGVASGNFTVPANVRSGTKTVEFVGAGGSKGSALYAGLGTAVVRSMASAPVAASAVSSNSWVLYSPNKAGDPSSFTNMFASPFYAPEGVQGFARYTGTDPLAQTFALSESKQIGAVDVWVTAKGTSPIHVQIRDTSVGMPTQTVLADARLAPSDIVVGQFNRFTFRFPVKLEAQREYAIVVLADDDVSAAGIAELGKWDSVNLSWVTAQPYVIGTLLSSANASTWTPHQDKDLTFRLQSCEFATHTRTVSLGSVNVTAATDLMVFAMNALADDTCRIEYRLTLPDASQVIVNSNQPVKLMAPITGMVTIDALLYGSALSTPVLFPDVQLIHGAIGATGTYYTRAEVAGTGSRIRVIYDALLPSGSTATIEVSGVDIGDTFAACPQIATKNLDDGWVEYTHELAGVDEAMVRSRLTLAGSTAARPYVRNYRMLVM